MMNLKLSLLAGAALLLGGLTVPAGAVTITQTATFGPAPTDYNSTGPGSQTLSYFDGNLGTLISVTLRATYGFSSNITISISAQSNSSGNVRTESAAGFGSNVGSIDSILENFIDTQGAITVGGTDVNPAAFDQLGTRSNYTLTPGSSRQVTSTGATQTFQADPLTDGTSLAAFSQIGGGTFLAQLYTGTGTVLSNTGGNTSAVQSTTGTGTLTVIYDYTAAVTPPPAAVPEPASLALLGAGLLGAGLIRRRSV